MPLINFAGLASGIDSESLISATIEAARARDIEPKEKQKTDYKDTNDALEGMRDLVVDLQETAKQFRVLGGSAIFKQAVSSDETVASVTAANGAANQSFTLTVNQVARTGTFSFADTFASLTAPVAAGIVSTGNPNDQIQIDIGTGTSQVTTMITVDATTTISDIIDDFNSNTANDGRAVMSYVNVAAPGATASYKIVLSSLKEGELEGTIAVTSGANIITAGVLNHALATTNQAQNAEFTVSGIAGVIERSTNNVSDVFTGITMNLDKAGTTTVTVSDDFDATAALIQEYVDKYNAIIDYANENNLIAKESEDPDALNVFGPLARTSVDEGLVGVLRSAIANSKYDVEGAPIRIMADLGVQSQQSGKLIFNIDNILTPSFKDAMSTDPSAVKEILEALGDFNAGLTLEGGTVDPIIRFNGVMDISIRGNKEQIDRLNDQIARAEKSIARQEESLRQRFARLEGLVGRLQSQQSALSSALAGL
jgi:flagellar hook-associated protein 2